MSDRPGRLEGKVAIVTGAGSSGPGVGNGKAASVLFAREGAKVLLVDIDADSAQETLELITAGGRRGQRLSGRRHERGPLPFHGRDRGRAVRQARHPR